MTLLRFWWRCLVSFLVRVTYSFDLIDYSDLVRELADTRRENDRLRVAFVRAKAVIARQQFQDAPTLPSMQAAEPATMRSMRVAARACEYLTITPPGDGVEISR